MLLHEADVGSEEVEPVEGVTYRVEIGVTGRWWEEFVDHPQGAIRHGPRVEIRLHEEGGSAPSRAGDDHVSRQLLRPNRVERLVYGIESRSTDRQRHEGRESGVALELPAPSFGPQLLRAHAHVAYGIAEPLWVGFRPGVEGLEQVLDAELLLELQVVENASLHQLEISGGQFAGARGLVVGGQTCPHAVRWRASWLSKAWSKRPSDPASS